MREYGQHLFLSYLYKQSKSERILFKGGTALRIIFNSPRYSEDLDFTGVNITQREIEDIFVNVLLDLENFNIKINLEEGKITTGGYLGIIQFNVYGKKIKIQIEVSLRKRKKIDITRALIENEYISPYTLVHLPLEEIIKGKIEALFNRQKPRDFYDYFFLLSGNYSLVKDKENLKSVLKILKKTKINFRYELRDFLPKSHLNAFERF